MEPTLNKRIFWDVDFDKMDFDASANFVIARVMERGDIDDIRWMRRYYGDEKVTEVLLNVKFLPEKRIHLAAAITNRKVTDFLCYKNRQSNPELYPY